MLQVSSSKTLTPDLQEKLCQFQTFFANKIVVVAYSGGVDSTVVAELAFRYAKRMVALTTDSITILPGEVEKAHNLAIIRGWEHRIVTINELETEDFAKNPTDRCYYCKAGLSEELLKLANEINADIIVEGTNVSEVKGYRPGLRALKEKHIMSPLLELGLTKENIRALARYFDLSNAEKPSLACLSSRFPYGVRITPEKLKRVGQAERYIIDTYHIETLRVRDHDGIARIEVSQDERIKLLKPEILDDIAIKLKSFGFMYITLDCQGYRSGSLNEVIELHIE